MRRHTARSGRVRCPRVDLHSASGRLGHHACRHYDRRARCSLELGAALAAMPAAFGAASHEAWPGPRLGDESPLAGTAVERRQASAPDSGRAAQAAYSVARPAPAGADLRHCVCRRSASLFLSFVARMNGVKSGSGVKACRSYPDIAPLIRATGRLTSLFDKTRARSRRENELLFFSPRAGRGWSPLS